MTQDYLVSLTSEYVLVEMFTNSKSGSFFFYSADYRFILKTCTKREAAFLMAALPNLGSSSAKATKLRLQSPAMWSRPDSLIAHS